MVKQIEGEENYEEAVASTEIVVVDFYATWCGPCKAIAPLITQLEIKLTDEGNPYKGKVSFIKVDVDSSTTLARKMNIAAMPTFLIYSKGKVAKTIVGANFNAIQDFLQDLLQKGESKQPEEKEELHKEEAEEEVTSI